MRWLTPILALITFASCGAEAPVRDRLVPGEAYFSQGSGQDTIIVSKGFGGEGLGMHRLTYELAPDDKLKISYWLMSEEQPIAEQTFELNSELAHQLRRDFWRLRPEKFAAELWNDWPTLPLGCDRRGPHDFPEMWVLFLPDTNKPAGRAFDLPATESCNSSAAQQARLLIEDAIATLPNSKIADEFHKAMYAYDPYDPSLDHHPIESLANWSV